MKKRFKIAVCVLCTLFLIPMVALAESGIIYYVANAGNDENSGTSPDDAWQTLDKINSEHFSPGNSILFKRNDHWRGHLIPQSGSTDGYVTYAAYGTGNKPLLLGSIEKNDLTNWIYEGNDIWAATEPETLGEELFANPSFDENADNWYFITGVYDNSAKTQKLYVDGELKDSYTRTNTLGTLSGITYLGTMNPATTSSPQRFDGIIEAKDEKSLSVILKNRIGTLKECDEVHIKFLYLLNHLKI